MKNVKLAVLLTIVLTLVVVVVQNTAPVRTRFLWLTADVPAVLLLFLTAAGGFAAGILVALLMRKQTKRSS